MQIAVHYAEIGLKGKNRPRFEADLCRGIERALVGLGPVRVRRLFGRILADVPEATAFDDVAERLGGCFGIAYFSRVTSCKPSLEEIARTVDAYVDGLRFQSFGIRARRTHKGHPFRSSDLARDIGARVAARTGARVDLQAPELWIEIHVLADEAFILHERIAGPGGLPSGSAGRALSLISGGIDSPVASYELMRRGARLRFVHFHSAPFTSLASIEKVRDIVARLAVHQGPVQLHVIPFGELQTELVQKAPAEPRIVLYRRFMLRLAEAIAARHGARALVTGDSLGQVSSQTLGNLDTINRVAKLPVLRPLIGMDKAEIVARAKRIGTFEISIEPDEDCCSYLMPARPATWTRPEQIERIERALDVERLVTDALNRSECERIEPSS